MKLETSEGQRRLIEDVINRGICVRCGACVGLCPYFNYFDGEVVVLDHCNSDTWRCLQICPRAQYEGTYIDDSLAPDPVGGMHEIGSYKKIMIARAGDQEIRKRGQYGGVVSALVIYALEHGCLKAAVLTDKGNGLSPGGTIARNRSEVLDCGGSRYSASAGLSALNIAIKSGQDRLCFVGLPCQMEALARMSLLRPDGEDRGGRVLLKIGIFCTWAIDYRLLRAFLRREGVGGTVLSFDIPPPPSEKFLVQTEKGLKEFALSAIRPLVQKGCALCRDMTAEWADLSVGAMEGREGWNTLIVRTDTGMKFVDDAIKGHWLESENLPMENLDHLKMAALNKRERGNKARADIYGNGAQE